MNKLLLLIPFFALLLIPISTSYGFWWIFDDEEKQQEQLDLENKEYCYYLFTDFFDFMYDVLFYQVIFNLPSNAQLEDYPTDLYIEENMKLLMNDFEENNCKEYRYLLDDDEYIKFRASNLSYNLELADYHQNEYHNTQSSGISGFIGEHQDTIKLLLKLLI